MADFTRSEVVTKYVEYRVPVWADHGAAVGEVYKALAVAENEVKKLTGAEAITWDDWCRIIPGDEHIIIRFEVRP